MGRFCGDCGAEHRPTQKFCQSCGASLSAEGPPSSKTSKSEPLRPKPERKTRVSDDYFCSKCGGRKYYTEVKGEELWDYCDACDADMALTLEGQKKKRTRFLIVIGGIFAAGLLFIAWAWGLFDNDEEPDSGVEETVEVAEPEPEPEPEPEESYSYADNPEACEAMLDANDLFLDSWEGIQNQTIPQDQLVANLEEGASILDAAYPAVPEGDMYWWMVSQANNLAIAASSFTSRDTAVTSEALTAYGNDIVGYEKFCQ